MFIWRSSRRSYRRSRHISYVGYMCILTVAFLSSFLTFTITFYKNSRYISTYLPSFLSPYSRQHGIRPLVHEKIENYKPREFNGKQQSLNYDISMKYKDFDYLQPITLTYNTRLYTNDSRLYFRFPKKTSVKALLIIFHSCGHTAFDWFHTPERQRIIGAAVELGYGCLAFQSTDEDSQCWSNDVDIYENKDVQMVFKGLESFYKEFPQHASLPRFTFGSSSGGIFSSIFAINQRHQIHGQIIYISIILPEILYTYVKANNYPPTAWIHMLRDIEFATEERIENSKQVFMQQNISHKTFPLEPIRLMPSTFSDRIPSIRLETSRFIFVRFRKNHWLNSDNFLKYNPRRKLTWQTFLFPSLDDKTYDKTIVSELHLNKEKIDDFINTVYGEHEISYERSFEALKWLQESSKSSRNQINPKK